MDFKILAVGDVVGTPGVDRICRSLRQLKKRTGADFVTVCGENASGVGMTPRQGEDLLDAGADVITMGNHTFSKREIVDQDRGRFSVLTKGIRYAILKQGDVICQEEHESNQKPAFIM